jgi:hypothetical protein
MQNRLKPSSTNLHDVEGGGDQRVAAEAEDHAGRVRRAQASEGRPAGVEREVGPRQLCSRPNAHEHAEDRPGQRQGDPGLDRIVIVVGEAVRVRLAIVVRPHDEGAEARAEEHDDNPVYAERVGTSGCGHGQARDEDAKEDDQGVLAFAGG